MGEPMGKSTATCWNPLAPEAGWKWTPVKGLEGMSDEITLSLDADSEEYTQLTGHYASRPPGEVQWAVQDGRGLRGSRGVVSEANIKVGLV